jgi:tetratricopeptide (TPR) repeat protein
MHQRTLGRHLPSILLIAALVGGTAACAAAPAGAAPATARAAAAATTPAASATLGPTATSAPSSRPVVVESAAQQQIDLLLRLVEADPTDGEAQRDLGLALLQRVRETADPSLYALAEAAFLTARELRPDDPLVGIGIGAMQLGRHEFAEALDTAQATLDLAPGDPSARGIVIDALIELGRYEEAFAEAEALAAAQPDLASLARLSYAHELRGDLPAALLAMERAAAAPGLAPENTAYVLALVGHLRTMTGDPTGAAAAYRQALAVVPDHAPSLAGEGRLALAAGDLATARARFDRAAKVVPSPEYVVAHGETLELQGDAAAAEDQFELARALITLSRANGVVVDVDLALFEADHGDAAIALELAEIAYAAAPTVRAADARAWALHRLGRHTEATESSTEALRLGSRDPLLLFHAGAITASLGREAQAREYLEAALEIDAGFAPAGAAEARRLLADLGS